MAEKSCVQSGNVNCQVCLNVASDPRNLPCGHWFCGPSRNCLPSMMWDNGSVECIVCRRIFRNLDINALEVNELVSKQLEAMNLQSGAPRIRDLKEGEFCPFHSDQTMRLFCESCSRRICDICWGIHEESHKVILLQIKRRQMMLNYVGQCNLGEKLTSYDELKKQHQRPRGIIVDLLASCDLFGRHVEAKLNEILELKTRFDKLKNKDVSCNDKFVKQLYADFSAFGGQETNRYIFGLAKQLKEENAAKMKQVVQTAQPSSTSEIIFNDSAEDCIPRCSKSPEKQEKKSRHKKSPQRNPDSDVCKTGPGSYGKTTGQIYSEQIMYTDESLLSSPHSIAVAISQSYKFENGLLAQVAVRFKPIPGICSKLRRKAGDIVNFEDHRLSPSRFIYCLVTKPDQENATSVYAHMESCLEKMLHHANENNQSVICMPKLGCIDGDNLRCEKVEQMVKKVFANSNIILKVHL